jgi:adenine-specific DNA-methyltransferase
MSKKPKLELTWIGKEERPRLEPRILIEDTTLSHHAATRRDGDIFDNMLIQGDNLLALKALETDYAGKVKCIYIDPPFNTGNDFLYYTDGLEHSQWLTMMKDRLTILRYLLTEDGIIWVHIDDKELYYLKIVMDEIFGRSNFLNNIVVKTSDPSGLKTVNPSPYSQTEYILMYAKDRSKYKYDMTYVESDYDDGYGRYIENIDDPHEIWRVVGLNEKVATDLGFTSTREARKKLGRVGFRTHVAQFALEHSNAVFQATAISNDAGSAIVTVREASKAAPGKVLVCRREAPLDDVYVLDGRQVYFYKSKVRTINGERVPAKPLTNLWTDVPWNGIAREGGVDFKNGKKPERLISRCIALSTKVGDLVLDSFAGSGTTGAVAHKMGRRWIVVELGEHAKTHIVPRLNRVIDGADPSGVTEAIGWQGGGGYRFFRLAPSLLSEDKYGNWVISKDYNPAMLAEALCKHMGYTYAPSQNPENYWQHGQSTETDFIYVTTQQLTHDACKKIADDVGPDRSLLICCKAYSANPDAFGNLTLVKIPTAILKKCEWGRDDYSLAIADLPEADDAPADQERPKPAGSRPAKSLPLFDDGEEQ